MLEKYRKVLVTGGAGFIGRHLVESLLGLGKTVTILDDYSTACDRSVPSGVVAAHADLSDEHQTAQALAGAELLFHAGGNSSPTASVNDPRGDFEANACGTFNVLEAALKAGAKRVVLLSSSWVYGRPSRVPVAEDAPLRPFTPHGASTLAGELYGRAFFKTYGLETVTARLFSVYGPGEDPRRSLVEVSRYLRWHLNGKPVQTVGDLDGKSRDYLHVSDAVQGLFLLADKGEPGETYNLASGKETTLRELLDAVGKATGRQPLVQAVPEADEDSFRLGADIAKLEALGFEPKTSLDEGLKALAAALGEAPALPAGATFFRPGRTAEK